MSTALYEQAAVHAAAVTRDYIVEPRIGQFIYFHLRIYLDSVLIGFFFDLVFLYRLSDGDWCKRTAGRAGQGQIPKVFGDCAFASGKWTGKNRADSRNLWK